MRLHSNKASEKGDEEFQYHKCNATVYLFYLGVPTFFSISIIRIISMILMIFENVNDAFQEIKLPTNYFFKIILFCFIIKNKT